MSDLKNVEGKKLKKGLMDFQASMLGQLLEDTFEYEGKQWKMRLLNDEEQVWVTSMVNTSNQVSSFISSRTPQLAIAIREIDGEPVYQFFQDAWMDLEDEVRISLERANPYALKYFVAEHVFEFLSAFPPTFIQGLWLEYQKLEKRSKEAKESGKK